MAYIRYFLLGFGAIALFVGAFVIFNTLSITVAQRTREFATLRTLGASRKQVLRSVRLEGLAIGLLASVIGLVLGFGIAKGMLVLFSAMGVDLPKADTVFAPRTVVVSLLVGTGITLLATIVPARRATRVPPIAAVREGAALPASRFARVARLLVTPLARVVGWPARRVGGIAGELAGANAVRNPARTAATAAALMIGLTLVTVGGGAGRRASTRRPGGGHRPAPCGLRRSTATSQLPFNAAEGDELASVAGVEVASHVRADKALVKGEEIDVSGIDPATIARFYRFEWLQGLRPDARAARDRRRARDQELRQGPSPRPSAAGSRSSRRRARSGPSSCAGSTTRRGSRALLYDVSIAQATFDAAFPSPKNAFTFLDADPGAAKALEAAARTPATPSCTPVRRTRRTRPRTWRRSWRCSTCCSGSRSS